jgi:hypothetical protein
MVMVFVFHHLIISGRLLGKFKQPASSQLISIKNISEPDKIVKIFLHKLVHKYKIEDVFTFTAST